MYNRVFWLDDSPKKELDRLSVSGNGVVKMVEKFLGHGDISKTISAAAMFFGV